MTSAETDDKLSHTLRSTLEVGFGQARACHLVLNSLHLKKLNFEKIKYFHLDPIGCIEIFKTKAQFVESPSQHYIPHRKCKGKMYYELFQLFTPIHSPFDHDTIEELSNVDCERCKHPT